MLTSPSNGVAPHFSALDLDDDALGEIPPRYPITDFFRNPDRGFYRLSDDGTLLAFMEPVSIDGKPARMNIFVQPLEGSQPTGTPRRITSETERDISHYFWKGSKTILYEKDFKGDENFHVIAVDVHTGTVHDLTPYEGVRAGVQDDLEDDPLHILISHNQRNAEVFDVYRVNVQDGTSESVAQNPGNVVGWQTDHDGKVRMALVSDGLDTALLYRPDETRPFQSIIQTDFRTTVSPQFFDFDNQSFYALSNRSRDKLALVRIHPERPHDEEVVFEVDEVDLDGAGYSRWRKVLTMAVYQTHKPQRHFFDELARHQYEQARAHLPGYDIAFQDSTQDETKFIVAAYNDRTPGARYLYDSQLNTVYKLGDINPALPEAHMAPVRPVLYKSRDGLPIHGYLTLPLGRPLKIYLA